MNTAKAPSPEAQALQDRITKVVDLYKQSQALVQQHTALMSEYRGMLKVYQEQAQALVDAAKEADPVNSKGNGKSKKSNG